MGTDCKILGVLSLGLALQMHGLGHCWASVASLQFSGTALGVVFVSFGYQNTD